MAPSQTPEGLSEQDDSYDNTAGAKCARGEHV